MTTSSPQHPAETRSPRRWYFFAAGFLLFLLGPGVYFLEFRAKHLGLPWYVPVLAAIGVILMSVWAWQRPRWWRIASVVPFAIVCGLEWFIVFVATSTPTYTGPAEVGRAIPKFATALADGTPFTDDELRQGVPTALVFFRGRW
jgi:hypothetical protein